MSEVVRTRLLRELEHVLHYEVARRYLASMPGGSVEKTKAAFDKFRAAYQARQMRLTPANQDQVRQMTEFDGLELWNDGSADPNEEQGQSKPPMLTFDDVKARITLWAVRQLDVPYAAENCAFGKSLELGVIKHSNLTGGQPAYCAGEVVILDEKTILVNGSSGRYGPEFAEELATIAKAFKEFGYNVWCMGFDEEQARALPFGGSVPSWVA